MPICNDLIKDRTIRLRPSGGNDADKACQLLAGIDGIDRLQAEAPDRLRIRYDVRQLTLQGIESALAEVGFSLNDSLFNTLQRAVFAYCEDALRSNLGADLAREQEHASLSLMRETPFDPRPDDWRHYVQD